MVQRSRPEYTFVTVVGPQQPEEAGLVCEWKYGKYSKVKVIKQMQLQFAKI